MHTDRNQALTMYPMFFDPIYKRVYLEEKDGRKSLKYKDDIWGVRLEDNGDVTFAMYAPTAQSVEVAGLGGSMGSERIALNRRETAALPGRCRASPPASIITSGMWTECR